MGPPPDDERPASAKSAHDVRLQELTSDVAARLQRVCATLPPEEFAALARQIAEVRMKYDEITHERPIVGAPKSPPRRPT